VIDEGTHDCPAPDCQVIGLPPDLFACRAHWLSIPEPLREQLWTEYRRNFGLGSYWQARANCLRALAVPSEQIPAMNAGVS
jgi:hypothetical protein